jgi:flagellar hook-length control protein FliK
MSITLLTAMPSAEPAPSNALPAAQGQAASAGTGGIFALLFQGAVGQAQLPLPPNGQGGDDAAEGLDLAGLLGTKNDAGDIPGATDGDDAATLGLAAWLAGQKAAETKGAESGNAKKGKAGDAGDAPSDSLAALAAAPVEAKALPGNAGDEAKPAGKGVLAAASKAMGAPQAALAAGNADAASNADAAKLADKGEASAGQPAFDALLASHAANKADATDAAARPAAAAEQRISAPLSDAPRWTAQVGDKVLWMNKNGVQEVHLQLTPAHLGPMTVSLSVSGEDGKAHALFTAASHEARQALEDAMPRLREMLSSAGISLDSAQVGQQFPGYSTQQEQWQSAMEKQQQSFPGNATRDEEGNAGSYTPASSIAAQAGSGLVNIFA